MLWIILFLASIILLIYFGKQNEEGFAIASFISALGCVIILALLLPEGIMTYPKLVGQLHKVKTLQQRIDDIKDAVYPEQSGKLVGGSLTNLQQSSKLSDYLRQIAEAEASYNSLLVKAQFYKKDYIWLLFGHGFFISNKVFQLSKIEK